MVQSLNQKFFKNHFLFWNRHLKEFVRGESALTTRLLAPVPPRPVPEKSQRGKTERAESTRASDMVGLVTKYSWQFPYIISLHNSPCNSPCTSPCNCLWTLGAAKGSTEASTYKQWLRTRPELDMN